MALSSNELTHLANLAKLELTDSQIDPVKSKIDYFLTLAQRLNEIDTHDVTPLTHPLDMQQPLRKDTATTQPTHFNDQLLTEHMRNNLYSVPAVLDTSN